MTFLTKANTQVLLQHTKLEIMNTDSFPQHPQSNSHLRITPRFIFNEVHARRFRTFFLCAAIRLT